MNHTHEQSLHEQKRFEHVQPALAMRWAGDELTGHAWHVTERVFEHLGVSDAEERNARLDELFADLECGNYRPDEAGEPIALRQGQVALQQQRDHHADQALRQAVSVQYEYRRGLSPMTASGMGAFDSSLKRSFQLMQSRLLEAQRHLTALDILNNLEGKHYSLRAHKGGSKRIRPASEQEHQVLLAVMVKNMLYNEPEAINRHKGNLDALAAEWAQKLFKLNNEYQILDISCEQLQVDIHTFLLKRSESLE
ncbi:hypothetical protein ELY33_12360 [Vreelandella andesensis]|uniref:Uncharacterized protein n=1 Tax=Vreelandella andesensis TaxID=447567 RepID=A0A3S0YUB8_9GAMM|nr:hypothetical protein [Halomonas andesensis]RUR29730.1 hypothetical protein ELY33_12360 [Halomonas andesensis]